MTLYPQVHFEKHRLGDKGVRFYFETTIRKKYRGKFHLVKCVTNWTHTLGLEFEDQAHLDALNSFMINVYMFMMFGKIDKTLMYYSDRGLPVYPIDWDQRTEEQRLREDYAIYFESKRYD